MKLCKACWRQPAASRKHFCMFHAFLGRSPTQTHSGVLQLGRWGAQPVWFYRMGGGKQRTCKGGGGKEWVLSSVEWVEVSWRLTEWVEVSWRLREWVEVSWRLREWVEVSWRLREWVEVSWRLREWVEVSWSYRVGGGKLKLQSGWR